MLYLHVQYWHLLTRLGISIEDGLGFIRTRLLLSETPITFIQSKTQQDQMVAISSKNTKRKLERFRGPSVKIHKDKKAKPSFGPALLFLSCFSAAYVYLQRYVSVISSPTNTDFLTVDHPLIAGILTLVGIANIFNHVAGYLQPVPMWSLFTGAFIDFNSSAFYAIVYYVIGFTPTWLSISWVFQMGIHAYYMSTGLSKPEASAQAFASLMAHMRKLQTNTKDWWNTLFLYFDIIFHCVFLIQVAPLVPLWVWGVDVVLGAGLYNFLYNRAADTDAESKRPILYIDAATHELRCPCSVCKRTKPFNVGCSQWFASIDQLYLDCWGIYDNDQKQTKTLMERVRHAEEEEERAMSRCASGIRAHRRSTLHVMY